MDKSVCVLVRRDREGDGGRERDRVYERERDRQRGRRREGERERERERKRERERERERHTHTHTSHSSIHLTSTPTFFSRLATAMAESDVDGEVCVHCTTSNSFITWAGVKKCIPNTYGSLHGKIGERRR